MTVQPSGPRSLLVIADRVYTLAPGEDAAANAVLVRDGVIAAVGAAAALRSAAGDAHVLPLPGAVLTPGLTDAHIHLSEWALARRELDLSRADSPAAIARDLAQHAAGQETEWVRGRGWNPHRWGGDYPDRALLDPLLPDRPVLLQSHDMHALWVNSETLRRARIEADTPDPEGGRIVRDEQGRPTGVLLENAAQLVARCLPQLTADETADALVDAQRELHTLGITGVHSFPALHIAEPEPLGVLETLRARGRLRLRVLQHLPLRQLDEAIRIGLRSGFGGEWIHVGGVKLFLDGALGSRTAWMSEPYEGSNARGIQVLDAGEFRYHVRRAAAAGIASTVHAIGDAAVVRAFEVLAQADTRVSDMPHRIEHVQCLPEGLAPALAGAGITCSMQPGHLITDWRIADRHWGSERSARTYALHTLQRAGARLAFGSDAPVEPADPRMGIYAATTRMDLDGQPSGGWFAHERITVREAILGYTRGPASAAGGHGGVLRPGALADFVAWQPDPFTAQGAELLALRCIATIVGGDIVCC
jgi:predicted amidohydrolase YtcJ